MNLVKFVVFIAVLILAIPIFSSDIYAAPCDDGCCYRSCSAPYCSASCSLVMAGCVWADCTCGQYFNYSVYSCTRAIVTKCWWDKVCGLKKVTTCKRVCGIIVDNPNQVQAAACPLVCTSTWVESCWNKQFCDDTYGNCLSSPTKTSTSQLCASSTTPPPSGGGTTCTPTTCTPTCPTGTVNYNTGYPAPSASCSFRTGAENTNGTCAQSTTTISCWYPIPATPPAVTITVPSVVPVDSGGTRSNTTTAEGCVAPAGYVGKISNNTTTYDYVFDDLDTLNPNEALMVYFSDVDTDTLASAMSKVYDTGTGKMILNSRFGFMVRKEASGWNSIYIPRSNGVTQDWVKAGTVGAGLRAEILSTNSKKMVGIRDVSVSTASLKNNLKFSLEFYNEQSGLTDYDKVLDGSYAIYGASSRKSTFLPSGGDTIVSVPTWLNSGKDIVIDLTNPVADPISIGFASGTKINLGWKYTDSYSPIVRSIGDADRLTAGKITETIDDETSGINDYLFGTGATGSELFSGTPHLWVANNLASRTDVIDLNANEGGTIQFQSWGFDRSCNMAQVTSSIPMGSAWMTTRGGVVFSSGGVNFEALPLTGHTGFSTDTYWDNPFPFYKDEADVTSELVSASTSAVNSLLNPSIGTTRSLNHFDANNRVGFWYDSFKDKNVKLIAQKPTDYSVLTYTGNLNASAASSTLNDGSTACNISKHCVINVGGNLNIASNYSCDAKTTFIVAGTTNIEPDITASGFAQGCIIISKGDITISDGTYKSATSAYPKYDIVEAFMLTDGKINIPLVDSLESVRDGLLIHGSILGFGTTDGISINLGRSLKPLFNQSYPSVAVHFDNRYLNIAVDAFGGESEGYRREVGFKPL